MPVTIQREMVAAIIFKRKNISPRVSTLKIRILNARIEMQMQKHPSPVDVKVGKTYTLHNKDTGKKSIFILSQVLDFQFCLISLETGNRWNNPIFVDGFNMYYQIPFSNEIVDKIFECDDNHYWIVNTKTE
jgi:hypothetical protein